MQQNTDPLSVLPPALRLMPIETAASTSSEDEARIRRMSVDGENNNQHRRRRYDSNLRFSPRHGVVSKPALSRHLSLRRDVEHAAAETYLVTHLAFKLLRYLGVGYRWLSKLFALTFYAVLLMPGFIQVGYYYFFSSHIKRSVVYGDQPRNRYKAWGSLLGMQLAERDIIVACIDYRNFPQGTISDMIKDASQGISFICNNIIDYGGDPSRIYLMGQSAGAHIAACVLLDQAKKESEEKEIISWSVSQIKTYFGISGGYNIQSLVEHFHKRGLYRSLFLSIMEGEHSLQKFSPEVMVQCRSMKPMIPYLPQFVLFHGTGDHSIPSNASETFAAVLGKVGSKVKLVLYEDKTHTDLFLQDPLRGGKDKLFQDILASIHVDDPIALAEDANAPPQRRLVPEFMLQLAHKISPF